MIIKLNLANLYKASETIEAVRNASKDGYRLSAYEKTLILDASFILDAVFDKKNRINNIKDR
jgi:hypothetical protein